MRSIGAGVSRRGRGRRPESRCAVVDERRGARRRSRRRPACRTRRPRARRARTTPSGTGRCTRRRRGSRRRAVVGLGRRRSGTRPRARARRRGRAHGASSASPRGPLGPPTTRSVARGSSSRGERLDREVDALQRLDAPDEQQDGVRVEARAAAGLGLVARARTRGGRRPAGRSRCARDRRRSSRTSWSRSSCGRRDARDRRSARLRPRRVGRSGIVVEPATRPSRGRASGTW